MNKLPAVSGDSATKPVPCHVRIVVWARGPNGLRDGSSGRLQIIPCDSPDGYINPSVPEHLHHLTRPSGYMDHGVLASHADQRARGIHVCPCGRGDVDV